MVTRTKLLTCSKVTLIISVCSLSAATHTQRALAPIELLLYLTGWLTGFYMAMNCFHCGVVYYSVNTLTYSVVHVLYERPPNENLILLVKGGNLVNLRDDTKCIISWGG